MIKQQGKIFLLIGSTTVLVDFITYSILAYTGLLEINPAKTIGFITGTIFAYFANKRWTFSDKNHVSKSLWRFIILYGFTLWANVSINSFMILQLGTFPFAIQIAFGLATVISALLNFLGMKFFVFKST